MFYIHAYSCISPQKTFSGADLETLVLSRENKLAAIEPAYEGIPPGTLRRMGKAVKMSVAAAVQLLKGRERPAGIIIGTANGGMEDCVKFMNQIVEYDEGLLTPGNFVQSTPNGPASQIAFIDRNQGYNTTHVQRGLAFENAVLDAAMALSEQPDETYLLGAVDEISTYNYNVELLGEWYKDHPVSNAELYNGDSTGSIAGEGAAMFLVSALRQNALSRLEACSLIHGDDPAYVVEQLQGFVQEHQLQQKIDIFITGENGDNRFTKYYTMAENSMHSGAATLRFKHMSGEYPTASAQALWLATNIIQSQKIPPHMIKRPGAEKQIDTILIYNTYKGLQHSFMLVTAVK